MATNYTLPVSSQPVLGQGGTFTTVWYRYFSNLNIAANGYNVLQGEIVALQEQVNDLPLGYGIQGLMSIAQQGAATPGGVVILTLLNDEQTPSETSFYGTDDAGNKGWQPMLGAFAKTGSIDVSATANGVVSFQADLFYLQAIG
jgi:hypothetical protein